MTNLGSIKTEDLIDELKYRIKYGEKIDLSDLNWKSTDKELPDKDDNVIVALKSDSLGWIYGWWGGYHVLDNLENETDPECRVKWWMKINKPE